MVEVTLYTWNLAESLGSVTCMNELTEIFESQDVAPLAFKVLFVLFIDIVVIVVGVELLLVVNVSSELALISSR